MGVHLPKISKSTQLQQPPDRALYFFSAGRPSIDNASTYSYSVGRQGTWQERARHGTTGLRLTHMEFFIFVTGVCGYNSSHLGFSH